MKKIDYSSEIDSIVNELQFQLEHINGIDSKGYARIELLTLADQLRSALVNAQLDMDQLIRELKG